MAVLLVPLCCGFAYHKWMKQEGSVGRPSYEPAKEVPAWAGGRGEQTQPHEHAPHAQSLAIDLIRRKVWTGNILSDFKFHAANNHPTLGIFLHHPLHPLDTRERWSIFIAAASWTILFTSIMVAMKENAMKEDGEQDWGPVIAVMIFLFVTLPVMIMTAMGKNILSMEITHVPQESGCKRCIGSSCAKLCQCSFHTWTVFVVLLVLIQLTGGMEVRTPASNTTLNSTVIASNDTLNATAKETGVRIHIGHVDEVVRKFLWSKLQQVFLWFPKAFFIPYIGFWGKWHKEKKRLERLEAEEGKTLVHVELGEVGGIDAGDVVRG